ncbi:37S ribosomal protein S9, mitochondrial [Podospora pseudocomata]|uniref:37S ribosomal protein S9, mitochondrial n=1 Tax=Podospora pseudocomata TaxID=2093779 RepID=A0ABR0GNK7_9PEZI|nr:37S ribosomal protein S9, mitochondrial [Podospora pseudocomata]
MASIPTTRRGLAAAMRGAVRPRSLEQQFQALRLNAKGSRCLSTQSFQAAPEIDSVKLEGTIRARHARAVPVSPSYFSRTSRFNDSYLALDKLLRIYGNLPTIPANAVERVSWKTLDDFRHAVGEQVKATDYVKCLAIVKRLHQIHPKIKPAPVIQALNDFKRSVQAFSNETVKKTLDKYGRSLGSGRRKSSSARAWLVEGNGEVLVNGKTLADYFGRVHDRESAVWALHATGRMDKYNVWARVEGGGTTGQAEALTLAISRALMVHEPALKPALRRGNWLCHTRSKKGGEKEAWPREGEKETCVGQEIERFSGSIELSWVSHNGSNLGRVLPQFFSICKPDFVTTKLPTIDATQGFVRTGTPITVQYKAIGALRFTEHNVPSQSRREGEGIYNEPYYA